MYIRRVNREWELFQWIGAIALAALLTLLLAKSVAGGEVQQWDTPLAAGAAGTGELNRGLWDRGLWG